MNSLRLQAIELARGAWTWLRQVTGDAAYENYLSSLRRAGACGSPASLPSPACTEPLSREDFYLDALRRRYSTVSRCC
ncbi:MAG: YbdD/YjiX family protein [Candidatus Acidiferrales bacterium]